MYNYNTDKLVIIAYAVGAGGKFLANCLGISESACLQDWDLYELTSTEKKQLLLNRLESTPKGTWSDLDLGCWQMFEKSIDGMTAEEIHSIEWKFSGVVDISNSDKYYFQTTHDINSEFTFDVTNYKTVTDTIKSIRIFYEHFNMKDFDSIFISAFYKKWIAHIK